MRQGGLSGVLIWIEELVVRKELKYFSRVYFFFYFLYGVFFFLLFIFLNKLFRNKEVFDSTVRSFEAGFDGILLCQTSVRIHFFLIMTLFVLFDLELVLFVRFLLLDESYFVVFYVFFFFVMASFYLEFWLNKIVWIF